MFEILQIPWSDWRRAANTDVCPGRQTTSRRHCSIR